MTNRGGERRSTAARGAKKEKNEWIAYLLLAPVFVLLLVFGFYPPVQGLLYAFTDFSGGTSYRFIGFGNFIELFSDEQYGIFYISLFNMVALTAIGIVTGNVMTLSLAETLHNYKCKKISSAMRFLFLLPALVPGIVVTLIWTRLIFAPGSSGLMNTVLGAFGLGQSAWYYSGESSFISLCLTNFPWVGGTSFLIYLAGLQNISESVYDAARLDGCGAFRRVFSIDLPLIVGQIKYFIVMGIIQGFQNFSMQIVLNQDITNAGLVVPAYYMYSMAFSKGSRFGYASCIGFVIFILALAVTVINNKFIRTEKSA